MITKSDLSVVTQSNKLRRENGWLKFDNYDVMLGINAFLVNIARNGDDDIVDCPLDGISDDEVSMLESVDEEDLREASLIVYKKLKDQYELIYEFQKLNDNYGEDVVNYAIDQVEDGENDPWEVESFLDDQYLGEFRSSKEWAESYIADTYNVDYELENYIDYEAFASDAEDNIVIFLEGRRGNVAVIKV